MTADVNGDGLADVVGFYNEGTEVSLSTGSSFSSASTWTKQLGSALGWEVGKHPRMMADVNGDGKDDIVGFGNPGVVVSLSTGQSFAPTKLLKHFGHGSAWHVEKHPRMMADVDGDGRADVVGFGDNGVSVGLSVGSIFERSTTLRSFGYGHGWRFEKHPRMLADVNGDGRADIVGFDDLGVWISLSTDSGFDNPECWLLDFAS